MKTMRSTGLASLRHYDDLKKKQDGDGPTRAVIVRAGNSEKITTDDKPKNPWDLMLIVIVTGGVLLAITG